MPVDARTWIGVKTSALRRGVHLGEEKYRVAAQGKGQKVHDDLEEAKKRKKTQMGDLKADVARRGVRRIRGELIPHVQSYESAQRALGTGAPNAAASGLDP